MSVTEGQAQEKYGSNRDGCTALKGKEGAFGRSRTQGPTIYERKKRVDELEKKTAGREGIHQSKW